MGDTNFTFNSKQEMVNKMTEIAKEHSILKVLTCDEYLTSFVCENNQCEAIINGVKNNSTNKYQITRICTNHKCSLNRETISKCIYSFIGSRMNLSIRELVCRLMSINYSVGYFEVYAFYTFIENNAIKNSGNSNTNGTFMLSDIFTDIDFIMKNCIKEYEKEFKIVNPSFTVTTGETYFYSRNPDYVKLRPVTEIKIYDLTYYTLVLGVMFCPNDEPIITSFLLNHKVPGNDREHSKNALRFFIDCDRSDNMIYLTDFKVEVINELQNAKVDFFIKSRSLATFLEVSDRDEPEIIDACDYFLMLNYNVKTFCADPTKLINLQSKHFLRYHSNRKLWSLNNTKVTDFEFINEDMSQMDYFDFLNLLIWHISEDLESRQFDYDDILLSEGALELINMNNSENSIEGDEIQCSCDKYKEFELPCKHFNVEKHSKTNMLRREQETVENGMRNKIDPCFYASKYYHRHQLKNVKRIAPLIEMGPGMYRNLKVKIKMISKGEKSL